MTDVKVSSDPVMTVARVVRTLRTMSPDMPMQQADILLRIALKPGLTMTELTKDTGLSQSSISRNVAAMSKFHRLGKPGLNLVEAVVDPREPRRRMIFLTTNGKLFMTKLVRNLDEGFSIDKDTDARLEIDKAHEEAMASAASEPKRGRAAAPKV